MNANNEVKGKGSGPTGEVTFDGMLTGPLPDGPFVITVHYVFMSMGGTDEGMADVTNAPSTGGGGGGGT